MVQVHGAPPLSNEESRLENIKLTNLQGSHRLVA